MSKKINIQIMSVYGSVLFEYESADNTLKNTVEKAIEKRADLQRADLRRADLQRADLRGANLWGANLRRADLQRADLWGADLRGADLQRAKNLQPIYFNELYNLKLLPQETKIRMWKYLKNGKSPYQNAIYKVGKTYKVKDFSTDEYAECGIGLNVATLQWCLRDSLDKTEIELIEVEFKVSDIVAIPYWTDGKFRVKTFKVLRKISRNKGMDIMYKISGFKKVNFTIR